MRILCVVAHDDDERQRQVWGKIESVAVARKSSFGKLLWPVVGK